MTATRRRIYEGQAVTTLAQLRGTDKTILTNTAVDGPAKVTGIDVRVFDITSPTSPTSLIYSALGLASAVAMLPGLTVDGYWDADADGYNFRHTLASALWAMQGGHVYRIEYLVYTFSWGPMPVVVEIEVEPLFSSVV